MIYIWNWWEKKREKHRKESIMKNGYEKPGEYYCSTTARCRKGGKSRANSHGIAKSIIRAIFTDKKAIINKNLY